MARPHLKLEELNELSDAFAASGVDYIDARDEFLIGINRNYADERLKIVPIRNQQISSDLKRLNLTGRLKDGNVPFENWLANAILVFESHPDQLPLFQRALRKLERRGESTEVLLDIAEVPPLETKELTKEEIGDFQTVSFLATGAKRASAIAKILVPMFIEGKQMFKPDGQTPIYGSGTAWLISTVLIVTNYHVVANREVATQGEASDGDIRAQALASTALFFYDREGEEGRRIKINEVVALGKTDDEDFAILRLAENPNVAYLPILDEKVKMSEPVVTVKGTTATKALAVNIIQHPWGSYKRVAMRNNLVYEADYPKLHYFTDTLGGSSGSPVFDDYWRVVALHRAAVVETEAEYQGKNYGFVNQGIQVHAMMAKLLELSVSDPKVAVALEEIKTDQQNTSVFLTIG